MTSRVYIGTLIGVTVSCLLMAIIICALFDFQRNAENNVKNVLNTRMRYLSLKQIDLDWTRPGVLFRRKGQRKVVKRRMSFAGTSLQQREVKMETDDDGDENEGRTYVEVDLFCLLLDHTTHFSTFD